MWKLRHREIWYLAQDHTAQEEAELGFDLQNLHRLHWENWHGDYVERPIIQCVWRVEYERAWRDKRINRWVDPAFWNWVLFLSPTSCWSLNFREEVVSRCVYRASLVAQWLRICLPMQGTWVRALVWEDPTCCRATKPVSHNYWACALELTCRNYWARVPQLLKPALLEPVLRNKRSHCNEKPAHRNEE